MEGGGFGVKSVSNVVLNREVAQGKHFQEKKAVWNVKIIWSFAAKEMRLSGI